MHDTIGMTIDSGDTVNTQNPINVKYLSFEKASMFC